MKKTFLFSKKNLSLALAGAVSALSLSGCMTDESCYDQLACGSATRGVVMALPEFGIPSLTEMLPEIELSSSAVEEALNQAGVPDAVLNSLGVDLSDIDAVVDALEDQGISVSVDGIVEDLLVTQIAALETAVNAEIAGSMPEGGTATVELLGVEELTLNVDVNDINGTINDALGQLSIRAQLNFPIPSLETMMQGEDGGNSVDVDTITSVIDAIEISELGLRTMAPTESAVTDVKLLNPANKQAALRSTCETGQPKFDLLEALKVQLKQDVAGAQTQTLFNYSLTSSVDQCGVVLKAKTPVDLLDAMITGATLKMDITTGFPVETSRMLPVGKIKFTGSLELPGTITSLMKAFSGK
jgi:hypothetical protein